jgi:hypothetical protein
LLLKAYRLPVVVVNAESALVAACPGCPVEPVAVVAVQATCPPVGAPGLHVAPSVEAALSMCPEARGVALEGMIAAVTAEAATRTIPKIESFLIGNVFMINSLIVDDKRLHNRWPLNYSLKLNSFSAIYLQCNVIICSLENEIR